MPNPGENPDAYWVVTVGQEVGIFFHWCVAYHFISFVLLTTRQTTSGLMLVNMFMASAAPFKSGKRLGQMLCTCI